MKPNMFFVGILFLIVISSACGNDESNGLSAENTEELCKDGIDNDGDGATDRDDIECSAFYLIPEVIIEIPEQPKVQIKYAGLNGFAKNPIISHIFTADPSAKVFNGRIYLYASHDLDDQDDYNMTDYHIFSSDDMVNWQDHGVAFKAADVSWAALFYAPDAAYSAVTGKYYLYFPNGGSSIGVAVSDNPAGPFVDAIGKPLITGSTPGVRDVDWVFDPTCFVDDDGQAYLYFGGGMPDTGDNLRVIRLGEDMISLADESATTIIAPDFFEAAFLNKRNGIYYLSYSSTPNPSITIDYMMSNNPMDGFEYAGTALPNPDNNNGNNNHHSIVEYEGKWYIFYHNRVLANRDGYTDFQRSVAIDYLSFDGEGKIVTAPAKNGKVAQLKPLDAFSQLEAETIADQRGIKTGFVIESGETSGVAVTEIHNEDWIGYSQVNFGEGANVFNVKVASNAADGGTIHLFLNGCDVFSDLQGKQIGSCKVDSTKGEQKWKNFVCGIKQTKGVHDLYLRFSGEDDTALMSIDNFSFQQL